MSELSGVIVRANSTIKLKMPSGMTTDWTYLKGATVEQMLQEIAGSVGLKTVKKSETEIDAYRDLCGELLDQVYRCLPYIEEHECGEQYKGAAITARLNSIKAAIAKAEAIMWSKS